MDQIEKAIVYIGSYFMLFVAAISLKIVSDLPAFYDVLIFVACIYIVWARNEILIQHVIGSRIVTEGKKGKALISSIVRIILGMLGIKLMIMGFYQYVLVIYLIDYITWVKAGRALSHVVSFCTVERIVNESKA